MEKKLNPWLSMWFSPRKTIRHLLETKPKRGIWIFATLGPLSTIVILLAQYRSASAQFTPMMIIACILALILSPFIGMVLLLFSNWILYFTGRWINGQAPFFHVMSGLAWSRIPIFISLLMLLLILFFDPMIVLAYTLPFQWSWIWLVSSVVWIWSLILLVASLKEIQGFSIGRSIWNIVLAILMTMVISLGIGILVAIGIYIYAALGGVNYGG